MFELSQAVPVTFSDRMCHADCAWLILIVFSKDLWSWPDWVRVRMLHSGFSVCGFNSIVLVQVAVVSCSILIISGWWTQRLVLQMVWCVYTLQNLQQWADSAESPQLMTGINHMLGSVTPASAAFLRGTDPLLMGENPNWNEEVHRFFFFFFLMSWLFHVCNVIFKENCTENVTEHRILYQQNLFVTQNNQAENMCQ